MEQGASIPLHIPIVSMRKTMMKSVSYADPLGQLLPDGLERLAASGYFPDYDFLTH